MGLVMQLMVVDGAATEPHRQVNLMSYVVNDFCAFDAGALGLLALEQQNAIRSIFLSHSHADHIATLPLFIDNVYLPGPDCVKLYANASTIADLQAHIFNDRIWPDLLRISKQESPFVEFLEIKHGQQIEVDNLQVTAFDVEHTLPTLGFVIEDEHAAVAIVADTAPCDSIWRFLQNFENLKAVFLEISFPNSMQWLAKAAKHLTPHDFLGETRKLERHVEWLVTHVKPEFAEAIAQEVEGLQMDNCRFALAAHNYCF
jgi:ribonuclease BN (tRNA processing enzyme)